MHSKIVIADSSVLISLGKADCLFILKDLYGEIIIPPSVFAETIVKMDEASTNIIKASKWIHVKQLASDVYNYSFSSRLHIGEKEAIVLAKETDADLLLVDDKLARSAANNYGIRTVGTIGVIVKAKQVNIIPSASEVINKLRINGFFISDEIVRQVLETIGEI